MIAAIEKEIDAEREFAENSPMPEGHTAAKAFSAKTAATRSSRSTACRRKRAAVKAS